MSNRSRRTLGVATGTALLAAAVFVGAAPSAAAPSNDGTTTAGAMPDGAVATTPAKQPRGSFGLPVNVSVSTNETGMYVYATPVCYGAWKSCRSWFTIPGWGIDVKDVTTTGGYFVRWPSNWREGQSVTTGSVASYGRNLFGFGYYGSSTSLGTITRPYAARAITARLTSQNDQARTATIGGTATPNAEIKRNGIVVDRADQWGSWSATIRDLPIGTSTLSFDQYIDGRYRDRASVTVTIAGEVVPAKVTEPASVQPGAVNTIKGTATPGATFEVVDGAGVVIVPGGPFAVDGQGKWSFDHLVPAGATEFRFAIRQTAWGTPVTSEVFTLPADTMQPATVTTSTVHDGVSNTFRGTGTPGATYRVLNVSNNEIVAGGPFSVDEHGAWTFDRVVSRGAKEFRFKIEQTKGDDTDRSRLFTIPAE